MLRSRHGSQQRDIDAARQLGLLGLHFSSAARLRQDLSGLGLAVA